MIIKLKKDAIALNVPVPGCPAVPADRTVDWVQKF